MTLPKKSKDQIVRVLGVPQSTEPSIPPKQQRKLPSTLRAVRLAIAATRKGPFRLYWGTRDSTFCEVFSGSSRFAPEDFLEDLPKQTRAGNLIDYRALGQILVKRLGVPITVLRRTYLAGARGLVRRRNEPEVESVLDRLSPRTVHVDPIDWGFERMPRAWRGRLPSHLEYLTPQHRKKNLRDPGRHTFTAPEEVGETLDHLYQRAVRMREDAREAGALFTWKGGGVEDDVEAGVRALDLAPELWIRRRIARRSTVLSLSIYGTRRGYGETWDVVDLTPLAALIGAGAEEGCPAWRRAVYLVDRGDGLEWIILHPDHDRRDDVEESTRWPVYEGSPARSLVSMLSTLWPTPPRVRWILDDAPLIGAGEVR